MTFLEIAKKLKKEHKSTYPKIPTSKVFLHAFTPPEYKDVIKADRFFLNDAFDKLPYKSVNVKFIVPTQIMLTVKNLKDVKDIEAETEAFVMKKGVCYYVLDGHHRIAMNILKGSEKVKVYVFDVDL